MKISKKVIMLGFVLASALRANEFCSLELTEQKESCGMAERAPRPENELGQAVVGPCGACAAQIINNLNLGESSSSGDGIFPSVTATTGDITALLGDIVADAGNIEATSGSITAGNGLVATAGGANITGATVIAAGVGGILASTSGTGDITFDSDDTFIVDADGVIEINSSAGAINIGNDADAQPINIGTGASTRAITIGSVVGASTLSILAGSGGGSILINGGANGTNVLGTFSLNGVSLLAGAGDPDTVVTAAQGSLFLRTDGNSTSTRAYINTDGATAWTNIVTAA